ncbi:MAG TPA: hypothetical protein VMS64_28555 [Candidatus Methylomirabilis sp.]|nr:hypothetical protein [Candidatus Methylomirabilis sp.]
MPDVMKADPSARRRAIVTAFLGVLVGALLIGGFEWYRDSLRGWFTSRPAEMPRRLRLLFLLGGTLLSAPLVVWAVHLWSLGTKALRARQFPPPGYRVIRDTPVLGGRAALSRGRLLRGLSVGFGVTAVLLWLLVWQLARVLGAGA